jgi:quercetin dioxygenase-like cupin family protein
MCLVGAGSALAQDPLKAAPTHYKLAFENEYVQVLYIHYGPHEKSTMHSHPSGVVVNLTNGHLRFIDDKGKTQEVSAIHGEARWFPPFKHQVENLSNTTYDGIYIGIKAAPSAESAPSMEKLRPQELAAISAFLLMANRRDGQEPTNVPWPKPASSSQANLSNHNRQ